jgi:hypothetical protein
MLSHFTALLLAASVFKKHAEGKLYPIAKKRTTHRPKPWVGSLSLISTTALKAFDHPARLLNS